MTLGIKGLTHPQCEQMSLGTSDTLIFWIDSSQPQLMGHVFVNPVDHSAFMAMLWLATRGGREGEREFVETAATRMGRRLLGR